MKTYPSRLRDQLAKAFLGAAALAAATCLSPHAFAAAGVGQASITLRNNDAKFCYTHENLWLLTKTPDSFLAYATGSTVTWTVNAVKSSGPTTFTVFGGLTVTNTGSAPATIGNIVINLQRTNSPKNGGNASHVSLAANIADAVNGDAATSANIAAAGSQESAAVNAAWLKNNYTVAGAKGTFVETAGSGALEFTDAASNTLFSLTPQPVIPVGGSVTLLYKATFETTILPLAGTSLRVEALVSFGNAGERGGGGSTASNIDINGDVVVDLSTALQAGEQGVNDGDEANVRTVPSRVTLGAMPALPEECNDSVSLGDLVSDLAVTGTATLSNPLGFGTQTVSASSTFQVSVVVDGGAAGGQVCNTATLLGTSSGGTLNVVVGYTPDEFVDLTPDDSIDNPVNIGHQPILATYACCTGANRSVDSCVDVVFPPNSDIPTPGKFGTYTHGAYGEPGNGVPDLLILNNFTTTFAAAGLTIGINDGGGVKHHALWTGNNTGLAALRSALSGGGTPVALTADTTNATSTSGGILARQTATLTLNIGFNAAGLLGTSVTPLASLQLANLAVGSIIGSWTLTAAQATALNGRFISQVLADANNALGGNGLPGYVGSFGDLNQLVTELNESFDNLSPSSFALLYLAQP